MTITALQARAVAMPLLNPTKIATRVLTERQYLLVDLVDEHGLVGHGYSYIGTQGVRTALSAVEELLSAVYVGSLENPQALWAQAYQEVLLTGRRGVVIRALSAIDIALWDLLAKQAHMPLAALLGGQVDRPLPAYASGGYYRPTDDAPADVTAEIEFNQSQGFRDHKIKVGGASVIDDARRVAAAIEAIGDDGRLALDANNAYPSVEAARRACEAFESAAGGRPLWWFEEPLAPENFAGHAQLARELATPIATGEIHQTRWEFRQLLESGGVSFVQADAGVTGGVTEWMRIASAASVFDVAMAPHWHHNLHAHLAAATSNTAVVEHFAIEKGIYNFEELLVPESRMRFRDNQVIIADEPGIGLHWDMGTVEKYTISAV